MALVAVLGGLLTWRGSWAGPARRAVPALRSADVLDGDGSSTALDVPTDAIERSFSRGMPSLLRG